MQIVMLYTHKPTFGHFNRIISHIISGNTKVCNNNKTTKNEMSTGKKSHELFHAIKITVISFHLYRHIGTLYNVVGNTARTIDVTHENEPLSKRSI